MKSSPRGLALTIGCQHSTGRRSGRRTRVISSTSLAVQLAECRQYTLRQGLQIDSEWSDVMSGLKVDRPRYQALLQRVRTLRSEGRRVVVAVSMLDRFGRRLAERVRARDELTELGVKLHSVREGGEVNDMMATMLAVMAEDESKRTSVRVLNTWKGINLAGWFKVSPMLPWGYRARLATDEERKAGAPQTVLDVDPDQAPHVQECFARAAKGASMREIARWTETLPVEARGYRYNDGRVTTKETARKPRGDARKVSVHMVKHLLGNPVYVGRMDVNVGTKAEPE
jgi:DNA invertase Pin-like site-specific DNA recombinase